MPGMGTEKRFKTRFQVKAGLKAIDPKKARGNTTWKVEWCTTRMNTVPPKAGEEEGKAQDGSSKR